MASNRISNCIIIELYNLEIFSYNTTMYFFVFRIAFLHFCSCIFCTVLLFSSFSLSYCTVPHFVPLYLYHYAIYSIPYRTVCTIHMQSHPASLHHICYCCLCCFHMFLCCMHFVCSNSALLLQKNLIVFVYPIFH